MDELAKRIAALSPAKRALFEHRLQKESPSANWVVGLSRVDAPKRLPLSYAQEQIWFLDKLEGSTSEYNILEAWRLRGNPNLAALERAINALVERHETLRTRFGEACGEPFPIIEPALKIPFRVLDLSELESERKQKAVEEALRCELEKPFDLDRVPLMRVQLLVLGAGDQILSQTWHHIVSDAWSLGVFNRELTSLYDAFCLGRRNPLSPLPLQYSDYALWQRNELTGDKRERCVEYWRKQLADAPVLKLPLDRPRPAQQTTKGAHHSAVLAAGLSARLELLSRRENATLLMTFLAAFQVLLFRHSGQQDISVGFPVVDRTREEFEGLVGLFLNTLVLRADLSGNLTFRELLRLVSRLTLEGCAHSNLPFAKVVEELQPERSLSHTPLFQVFLNFSEEPEPLALTGLEIERCAVPITKAKFDLTLYVRKRDAGLQLDLVYNADLFEAATIERMLRRFQILLEAIAADADQRVGVLPLLAPEDQEEYSVRDHRAQPTNPFVSFTKDEVSQSMPARFRKQALKYPNNVAVKTSSCHWTYSELTQISERVARAILREGGEGEQRVALLFDHGAPMIAAILGTLMAGKTFVLLDPFHPKARLSRIVEHAQASLLVTDAANLELANELNACGSHRPINFDELEQNSPTEGIGVSPASDAIAYLLYAWGSTGEPKGVTQIHRNVLRHIANYTNSLHICAEDRLLLVASCGSDAAIMDIFGALLNGAALYPFDVRNASPTALAKWIVAQEITLYHSTPTLFRAFIGSLSDNQRLPTLRLIVLGGERVVPQDVELYKRHCGSNCLFVNRYGLSEYTVALQCLIDAGTENTGYSVPIGYPLEDTEVLLLNADGDAGQVCGEIAISSSYLAQGYWRLPELTAEAFRPDSRCQGRRIYRTGDQGRLLPNGMIEFLGRRDTQVEIRGHRVELGEVEAVLRKHPQVGCLAVVPSRRAVYGAELAAYVVPKSGGAISTRDLRTFAKIELPNYMIPSVFVLLERLPATPNGKIDWGALSSLETDNPEHTDPCMAPRNSIEERLAAVWSRLLGVERVGIHDSFFELGGHSLKVMKLLDETEKSTGRWLRVIDVFENPTVAGMAAKLQLSTNFGASPPVIEDFLLRLRAADGGRRPLFIIPGGWGGENEMLVFASMLPFLERDVPVYAAFSRALDETWPLPRDLGDQAAALLRAIRNVQPRGPYLILGECVASALAVEVARQAEGNGEPPGSIILLDAHTPFRPSFPTACLRRLGFPRAGWKTSKRTTLYGDPVPERMAQYYDLLINWKPGSFRSALYLVFTSSWTNPKKALSSWKQLAKGAVSDRHLACDHHSYLRKHVAETAALVNKILLEAAGNDLP